MGAPLDITSLTNNRDIIDLDASSTYNRIDIGDPGEVRIYTAVAVTTAVPVDTGQHERFIGSGGTTTTQARSPWGADRTGVIETHLVVCRITGDARGQRLRSMANTHNFLGSCSDQSIQHLFIRCEHSLHEHRSDSYISEGTEVKIQVKYDRYGDIDLQSGRIMQIKKHGGASHMGPEDGTECNSAVMSLTSLDYSAGSSSRTSTSSGECGTRTGTRVEVRRIDFDCIELTSGCRPASRSSTDIRTYFGSTSWENWLAAIREHEATSYSDVNSAGYLGYYQFGVAALETAGYLEAGSWNSMGDCKGQSEACRSVTNGIIDDSSKWTGRNGVNNKADYLANKNGCQEDAVRRHSNTHFTYLRSNGKLNLDNPNDVGGMLAAAHLRGAGGAENMRDGTEIADANGMFPSTYYTEIGGAVC